MIKVIVCKKIWKNIIHKLSEALKRKLMPYSYQLSKLLLQKRRYISPFVFVEAIKKWSGMRVSLLFCGKRFIVSSHNKTRFIIHSMLIFESIQLHPWTVPAVEVDPANTRARWARDTKVEGPQNHSNRESVTNTARVEKSQ